MSLYVYALLEGAAEGPPLARVRYVGCGSLTAAVRPARRAPLPRPAALRRHAQVVQVLWQALPAVLPVRFGALVEDERVLCAALGPRAAELRTALSRVRGRAQMTLRVVATAATRPPAAPPRGGKDYLARRAAWWRGDDVPGLAALLAALRPFRRAERIERHQGPPFTASVYHLVDRGRVTGYRRALARGRGRLRLAVSGPWPPYAFTPEVGP